MSADCSYGASEQAQQYECGRPSSVYDGSAASMKTWTVIVDKDRTHHPQLSAEERYWCRAMGFPSIKRALESWETPSNSSAVSADRRFNAQWADVSLGMVKNLIRSLADVHERGQSSARSGSGSGCEGYDEDQCFDRLQQDMEGLNINFVQDEDRYARYNAGDEDAAPGYFDEFPSEPDEATRCEHIFAWIDQLPDKPPSPEGNSLGEAELTRYAKEAATSASPDELNYCHQSHGNQWTAKPH